jgi:hypothetical protein
VDNSDESCSTSHDECVNNAIYWIATARVKELKCMEKETLQQCKADLIAATTASYKPPDAEHSLFLEAENTSVWLAQRKFERGTKLSDRIGRNEKTKITVRLTDPSEDAKIETQACSKQHQNVSEGSEKDSEFEQMLSSFLSKMEDNNETGGRGWQQQQWYKKKHATELEDDDDEEQYIMSNDQLAKLRGSKALTSMLKDSRLRKILL